MSNYFEKETLVLEGGEIHSVMAESMSVDLLWNIMTTDAIENSRTALIISHNDADGHCSSAIISFFESRICNSMDCVKVINTGNYDFDPSTIQAEIEAASIVYVTDLSFKQNQIDYISKHAKLFVWIDHHISSKSVQINYPNKAFKFVYSEIGISAAAMCWVYKQFIIDCLDFVVKMKIGKSSLNELIENLRTCESSEISSKIQCVEIVKLISLYDTFHEDANLDVRYAFMLTDHDINTESGYNFWKNTIGNFITHNYDHESYYNSIRNEKRIISNFIKAGETARKYANKEYAMCRNGSLVEFGLTLIINGNSIKYNMAAMNINSNSLAFGDIYYQKDGVIRYYQQSDGTYSYSCYANLNGENPINCEVLASMFGGGGHRGAAGWSSKENLIFGTTDDTIRFVDNITLTVL